MDPDLHYEIISQGVDKWESDYRKLSLEEGKHCEGELWLFFDSVCTQLEELVPTCARFTEVFEWLRSKEADHPSAVAPAVRACAQLISEHEERTRIREDRKTKTHERMTFLLKNTRLPLCFIACNTPQITRRPIHKRQGGTSAVSLRGQDKHP